MLRSLNTGATGIRQFQTQLDVIANNLANINTVGFKAGRVDFSDALSQTLRPPTSDSSNRTGSSSVQLGNGVGVAAIKNSFTQGAVNTTGVPTDLAITGEGFFIVKNTATSETFVTRSGDFRVDDSGNLVTNQGLRVQGFNKEIGINENYADTETPGDLRMDKGTVPAAAIPAGMTAAEVAAAGVSTVTVDSSGRINITLSNGITYTRGQVLLQKFNNPQALLKQGNNLYSGISQAGPLAKPGSAGLGGLGSIAPGQLEISNVDISREFTNMITTQRAYQANARVITASDDLLQETMRIMR